MKYKPAYNVYWPAEQGPKVIRIVGIIRVAGIIRRRVLYDELWYVLERQGLGIIIGVPGQLSAKNVSWKVGVAPTLWYHVFVFPAPNSWVLGLLHEILLESVLQLLSEIIYGIFTPFF